MNSGFEFLTPYGLLFFERNLNGVLIFRVIDGVKYELSQSLRDVLVKRYGSLFYKSFITLEHSNMLLNGIDFNLNAEEISGYTSLFKCILNNNNNRFAKINFSYVKLFVNFHKILNSYPHYLSTRNEVYLNNIGDILSGDEINSYMNLVNYFEVYPYFNEIVLHELTHAMSTDSTSKLYSSGLRSSKDGEVLNEGFTHIVTNTIYPEQCLVLNKEFLINMLVVQLVQIIGYKKMLHSYLNALGNDVIYDSIGKIDEWFNVECLIYKLDKLIVSESDFSFVQVKDDRKLVNLIMEVQNHLFSLFERVIHHNIKNNMNIDKLNHLIQSYKSVIVTKNILSRYNLDAYYSGDDYINDVLDKLSISLDKCIRR